MKKEQLGFLKFTLPNTISSVRGMLNAGRAIAANEALEKLLKEYHKMFPFKYGSEITADYKDEDIFEW